jgi:hypothetical protein
MAAPAAAALPLCLARFACGALSACSWIASPSLPSTEGAGVSSGRGRFDMTGWADPMRGGRRAKKEEVGREGRTVSNGVECSGTREQELR